VSGHSKGREGSGMGDYVTLRISRRTVERAVDALVTLSAAEKEPERYREWFADAAGELNTAYMAAGGDQ